MAPMRSSRPPTLEDREAAPSALMMPLGRVGNWRDCQLCRLVHRQVSRQPSQGPGTMRQLLGLLRRGNCGERLRHCGRQVGKLRRAAVGGLRHHRWIPGLQRRFQPVRNLLHWLYRHCRGWLLQGQLCLQDIGCRIRLWLPEREQDQCRSAVLSKSCGIFGRIDHAVIAVGYDSSASTFKIRNSWGASWGEAGYVRVSNSVSNPYCLYNTAPFVAQINADVTV